MILHLLRGGRLDRSRPQRLRPAGLVLGLVLLATACAFPVGPGVSGTVDPSPEAPEKVRFVYLGSGGWIFERGDDQVIAAPLFSNPDLFQTGLFGIEADTAEIDRYMAPYDVRGAQAILVGHAHYDHLMDVPRVALRHAPAARIVGSETVRHTLGSWSGVADRVDVVNGTQGDVETVGSWHHYGDGIRIMALDSKHAPHFDGYTLYQGHRERALEHQPTWATEWVDGETYAFLIDFLDPDSTIALRIYYQDAVSAAPAGFAPRELIDERPADVAIFVPATFDQVDWHPEAFVENLRPRRVLLGHWEDFFQPIENETRSILLTDIGHFEGRLVNVHSGPWWRPEIFTEFYFPIG